MNTIITFPLLGDQLVIDIPRYFTVFGFRIYYYALLIVLGFCLATLYLIRRRELFGLTTDNILDLLLISVPCGIIGARLYYMLFNFNDYFAPGKWGNIIDLRAGGLAVYGGIILSGLAFIIYSRRKKIPLGSLLDAAGFGLFIGQAIGRWGNFINAEAYGVETELPWKMGITKFGMTVYRHPTFLYESLWNGAGLLIMHIFSKRFKSKYPGQYFLFYVAWYGLGRFMIEGLRTDSLYFPGSEVRVSQLVAATSFIIALAILIYKQLPVKFKLVTVSEVEGGASETGTVTEADSDDAAELSAIDGAGKQDIDYENDDNPGNTDDDSNEGVDELAEIDGATADNLTEETEDDEDGKLETV